MRCNAEWTRFELATSCVTGRRSNQLNYHSEVSVHYIIGTFFVKPVSLFFLRSSGGDAIPGLCSQRAAERTDIIEHKVGG